MTDPTLFPITTTLGSGTYRAKCGSLACTSTSSHETAARNLVKKHLGEGYTVRLDRRMKALAAKAGAGKGRKDWEWDVFAIVKG